MITNCLARPGFLAGLLFLSFGCLAQNNAKEKADQSATVQVVVTNYENKPLKGEEVIFISSDKNKQLRGRTDAAGKFSFKLPAGDVYTIKLKTMTDTTSYSTMNIPALAPGEFFQGPFTVNIQYEAPRTFTLNNVHFDTGKPTLRPASYKELDEIAGYMKIKEEESYEIAGHTDNVGKEEDNLKLSQQRAESVKAYLVKKGIDASRLKAKGYGASQPVADNSTAEGRQKNRRTEVVTL
ncbi:MAG TPA: OmpA family protein [Flavisolibacter sp.]|nr:OmpA family protein [Flavisolibacter sp.]